MGLKEDAIAEKAKVQAAVDAVITKAKDKLKVIDPSAAEELEKNILGIYPLTIKVKGELKDEILDTDHELRGVIAGEYAIRKGVVKLTTYPGLKESELP
jgi:hypothetical protein